VSWGYSKRRPLPGEIRDEPESRFDVPPDTQEQGDGDLGEKSSGQLVGKDELFKINLDDQLILMGLATAPLEGVGIFLGLDPDDEEYEFRAGDPDGDFIHWDGTDLTITGTLIASVLRDVDSHFVIDLDAALLTITDDQASPETRVLIGRLGVGLDDYGIEVYDASGALILGADGLGINVVDTDQLVNLAVSEGKIQAGAVTAGKINVGTLEEISDDAGIIVSGQLRNLAGTRFIDLDAAGTDPFIKHNNMTLLADGTATFSGALSAATGTFAGSLSAATGTFSGVVAASSFTAASATFDGYIEVLDEDNLEPPTILTQSGLELGGQWGISDIHHESSGGDQYLEIVTGLDYILIQGPVQIGATEAFDNFLHTLSSGVFKIKDETVSFGANDSESAGFRNVRVPNA
jgi:hypothetical protein